MQVLLQSGRNQKEIADLICVSPYVICRELKRNIPRRGIGPGNYNANRAQFKNDMLHGG